MSGDKRDFGYWTHQDHQCLLSLAELMLEVFGMAGKLKFVAVYLIFVDWSCNQHVNIPLLHILDCTLQGNESSMSALRGAVSRRNLDILIRAVDKIESTRLRLCWALDDSEVGRQPKLIAIKQSCARHAIYNGDTHIAHGLICKGLKYDFISDTCQVTLSNADSYQFFFHLYVYNLRFALLRV